ncbi:extracellular solute-binding protein [Plantibacter sp. VKM Ac-2885]|uniref:Multiple sugar transport system substrate-binding protein n=1 Tax=Plantibacter flavus TaxID=150123 RepID=A0A3N2C8M3_9MICO|nr:MULTISPECIES: extracellular solute-binding protein [Plantibacter]MBD8533472.1 extracellular solute-binding protein [Plantibacter sp. CFBP 13570]MBF4511052.1 extracellular solute-binding protein [Plantibacter sp. VKM Ac-2885]ROR83674.1 multiple sugar transport system substrate-binding protein [Plantibacter flavus]SMG26122.1 multiple sugar transport system substrate-binding protein [Plantibacter flavus]
MNLKRTAVAAAVLSAVVLSGCSSTGSEGGSAAASCAPAEGKVDLSFTSWIPGIEEVVDVWNKENPDIQVKVQTGPNGNSGTYQNFFNQLKAGNAPDLGQIEYDALPNFRVQNGLMDLGACDDVMAAKDDFVDWTWGQVSLGESDSVYAVPQDSGPMAMFYRADLFEQNGIAIPTTWAEYKEAAKQVRATGAYITNFSQGDINQFAGFVWQAGGSWFDNDGSDWTVDLTDPASKKVADYWQDLIDEDLVSTVPTWTTEWDNAYNSSAAWTWNSAVWGANSIASGAPDTAGKWAVAKAPQWEAGDSAAGNWGGSSTAVFTGSKHPYEASKFALWLNTSDEALTMLNKSANIYPATKEGLNLPVLKEGVDFYGGQPIYDVFAEASSEVSEDFAWGPTMTQTYNDVSDGFKAAVSGDGTLLDALTKGQSATIDALKAQSIPVKE